MAEDATDKPSPAEQVSRLYEQAEAQSAKASEVLVGGSGFATLLGRMAENAAALTKLSSDGVDLALRSLRIAGRRDVTSLARQLARTEDKLERVLGEVEALREELTSATNGTRHEGRARRAPARRSKESG